MNGTRLARSARSLVRKNPRLFVAASEVSRLVTHPLREFHAWRGVHLDVQVGAYTMQVPGQSWWAYATGDYYEVNVTYWLERLLKAARSETHSAVLYDVGANYGYYCLRLAPVASAIYAFEPVLNTCQILRDNVARNDLDNVTVFRAGLADTNSVAHINIYKHSGNNSLFHVEDINPVRLLRQEPIDLVTLDSIITEQRLPPPVLIKADIEGAELYALQGAKRTIEEYHPTLVLEYNARQSACAGYRLDDLVDTIQQFGYHIFGIPRDPHNFSLIPHDNFDSDSTSIANILAVHWERRDEIMPILQS